MTCQFQSADQEHNALLFYLYRFGRDLLNQLLTKINDLVVVHIIFLLHLLFLFDVVKVYDEPEEFSSVWSNLIGIQAYKLGQLADHAAVVNFPKNSAVGSENVRNILSVFLLAIAY